MGGTWPYSLHSDQPLSAQEAASGVGAQPGTVASSPADCGAAGPGPSAWAAEYIFYLSETSIFLDSNPSCHHVDIGSFLTVLSFLTAALVGPGPCIMPGSQLQGPSWGPGPSHQPVPVVRKPGLPSSFLLGECQKLRDPALGWVGSGVSQWGLGEQPAGIPWPERGMWELFSTL
uniref:Uncharacterized protein n=1 Tax=Cebus imitator TaxID=2715852 RepID=A0A2K5RRT0_CEBIM